AEVAGAVAPYPRWGKGMFCDAARNMFRQHPLDYLEAFETSMREAAARAPRDAASLVRAIAVDTTGSTPAPVDATGAPLALRREFAANPNAMFLLWKDHTAVQEAGEINRLARSWGGTDFTKYEGGVYSSEWFWAKILHVLREDPAVREAAVSWVEHCDWFTAALTGVTDVRRIKRSRCAAGHKAMWHESFQGLPAEEFLVRLDPLLAGLRGRLYRETLTSDQSAGVLSADWTSRLGLSSGVRVGVGAFDAHMGAVGGGITPYTMTKIMGTSTCDVIVAPMGDVADRLVRGICGQVDGSVIPGMLGMEAGQSAFGDIYAWFKSVLMWPLENVLGGTVVDAGTRQRLLADAGERLLGELAEHAARVPLEESGVLALDWMNGRRTPDANQMLKGAIAGLNLGSDAPRIFRALVEATAFGARAIQERFRREGVPIRGVIALGGVAKKSPFIMQTVADVMNVPIRVPRSEQTCALGAAMFAAVVAGVYPTLEASMKAMESGWEKEYAPDPAAARVYDALYERYRSLARFVEEETVAQGGPA
ncbi:MAG TPA: ribulokinase, partial [Bacteroidota bacterium]|nr:ribulokinase [Bacteroidota bacterium]